MTEGVIIDRRSKEWRKDQGMAEGVRNGGRS